jgi:hypothetical protein
VDVQLLFEPKLSPGSFIGFLTKVKGVIPRAQWSSDVSTNAIKRWPREPAGTIGIAVRAAAAGAVLIGFAIWANSVHDGSLTLATLSAGRGPAVTDKCTDNPADPSCPPLGPNDAKCAGAWRYTAACVGGPFDPNNISNCSPITPGCPGFVPYTPPPTPPSIEPPPTEKGHEPPPPPHHHEPGSPPGTDHPGPGQPPPGTDHPGPGGPPPGAGHPGPATRDAPSHPQEVAPAPAVAPPAVAAPPVAPVGPPQAIEAPHAPDVPAPAIQAPVAPAPVMQAPVMAPAPVAPAAPPPVMAPAPAPSPSK